jgi:cytochrome c oxidase subunit 4
VSEATSHSHKSHKAEYFKIFFLLTFLTVAELFVPKMPWTQLAKGAALTFLALTKAGIVGWYYMHLKEETKWLKFIALIPISAFIYAAVVILESTYR